MANKPEQDSCDIAIIGGGMVGASLALLFARAMPLQRVVILDAKPFAGQAESPSQPSFDGRSTALAPTSAELFERFGLWQSLQQDAAPIRHIQVSDRGQWGAARFGPEDNAGEPLGYVVPNRSLGRSLLGSVRNNGLIDVRAPVEVTQLKPLQRGMEVQLRDAHGQQFMRAGLVVLADGAGSPLAERIGIRSHNKDYDQFALIANVSYEKPHGDTAFERFTPLGPMALLPLKPRLEGEAAAANRSALVWTRPLDSWEAMRALSDDALLAELQREFGFRLGRFTSIGARSFYPLSLQLAEEQVRSSLVLMGSAAHALHPVAGQGFNLALRDAARLTQIIAEGVAAGLAPGDLELLQKYEQQRQRDQATTVGLSDSFINVFAQSNPAIVAGRNLGMVSLELFGGWRETFLEHMSGRAQPRPHLNIREP